MAAWRRYRSSLAPALATSFVALMSCASPPGTPAIASPPSEPDERPAGARAFDFLYGAWEVSNRHLLDRLTGSEDWVEWPATLLVVPILGGYGNIDRYVAHPNGTLLEGYSVRVYDPDDEVWSIEWVDTSGLRLTHQVTGTMGTQTGTFYGEEEYDGRVIPMRFVWSHDRVDRARWEQAYQLDDGTWETNWVMEFTRR